MGSIWYILPMKFNSSCFTRCFLFVFALAFFSCFVFSFPACKPKNAEEPELLSLFKKAYPDIQFESRYDDFSGDWKISLMLESSSAEFFFAGGMFLPEPELENKNQYSPFLYKYDFVLRDPADFTDEDIEKIRQFSSPENRTRGKGTPQFFYDFVYDSKSRNSLEKHIKTVSFLGKKSNVHERIKNPLEKVEKEILEASKSDAEVKKFIDTLLSADSYSWRTISDSGNRSFHSLGLALDLLPKGWGKKNVYWAWRRDIDGDNWMKLPLERRWMPPQKVIEIFENNGFVWGGKWAIWDNMHFEYRPEVILFSKEN